MSFRISVVCITVAALLVSPFGWATEPAGPRTPASASTTTKDGSSQTLLNTSFEQVFPRLPWRISRPSGAAEVDWGRTTYRASEGQHSLYCAGMGPAAPDAGGPAPANTASWAIVGPYDLSATAAGTMTFDLWLRTEKYQDVFMWLVSTDGETFNGSARSTDTNGWQTITADLANWGVAGNVTGEAEVWFAFVYQSDFNNLFEGAYLDEVVLTVDLGTPGDEGATYTTNADFAEGAMVGLESTSDELEIADGWDALPYVWVPNSATGTVSKIDSGTGAELGRYATGPDSLVGPGVAAVDLQGSCWVGNRIAGTVVKIGLVENGGCVDRNGDGEIETSTDGNGDGSISSSELLAWGQDECVLFEVVLAEGLEGSHVPGDGHDDYEANGLQAVAVDANDDVWVGVYASNLLYHLDGASGDVLDQIDVADQSTFPTAAVVGGDGKLWVSSSPDQWVLSFDPSTGDTTLVDLPHLSRGVTINGSQDLLVTGGEQQAFSNFNIELNEIAWTQAAGYQANGIASSEDGRIWIASTGDNLLSRYDEQGGFTGSQTVLGQPTGVAVDQDGKVWVLGSRTDTVYRINPGSVNIEIQKTLTGTASHDATGDLTGIVARNMTSRFGTWTVTYDSGVAGTPWGVVSWQAVTPTGTTVTVRVRSSEDEESWSAWEPTASGTELSLTPVGRYIEIQASIQALIGAQVPSLQELTVVPATVVDPPGASFAWSPMAPVVDQPVIFTDTSSGDPTSWLWDFDDGATSDLQNPTHSFSTQGEFNVGLTVGNEAGSDTITFPVTIGAASGCTLTCSASVPQTADLTAPVAFAADVTASGCSASTAYSWSFGDGTTSDEQNPSHSYTTTGTLPWTLTATADDASCVDSGVITVSGAGPQDCSSTYWVPVVSRANGANGSVWRSDLGLLGVDPNGAAVELRFHGSDPNPTRVVTVAPGAMVALVDVVNWLDEGFSGSGALEICSDGELDVTSRTYNTIAADQECLPGGTFGQYLAGELGTIGLTAGGSAWLGQLSESAAFRTNIGLVNTGAESATVDIALYDATGAELASLQVVVGPGEWRQENRPFQGLAGDQDLDAASAKVAVVSGGPVVAYASVIDDTTNDPTTIPMR